MPVISIRPPGATRAVTRSIAPGGVLLVGRAPDATRLASTLDGWRTEALTLDDDAVSSNHVVLWCDAQGVWVQDLASRNGTWLRLKTHPVVVAEPELFLDLAVPATGAATPLFPAPGWTDRKDFARSVMRSIEAALGDVGVDVVAMAVSPHQAPEGPRFALATGEMIEVHPARKGTLDARLPALMEAVASFVVTQNSLLDQESGHDADFILRSPALRDAHQRLWEAAVRGRRLLLLGASGTGKERLARCYHAHSDRRDGPFKAVNCALIRRELLHAQLFGAARGSFTHATRDLKGAVEAAHGGTLFLDEVAELDTDTQASLLRFLDQRGEYERLGDQETRHADVRIVCATNRDLRAEIRAKRFREDLWYRFAGAVVEVPPLRDRPEDVRAFLEAHRVNPALSAWQALAPDAQDLVRRHPWPGNFRELSNFAGRLSDTAGPGVVDRMTCERCLREGLAPLPDVPEARTDATDLPERWGEFLTRAANLWREDHPGAEPRTIGELKEFVESYLKPTFAAQVAGITPDTPADGLNWSALGRRLEVADGTTVKRWIERYLARTRPTRS
jgi:DNA-binding NtrC family response regulator